MIYPAWSIILLTILCLGVQFPLTLVYLVKASRLVRGGAHRGLMLSVYFYVLLLLLETIQSFVGIYSGHVAPSFPGHIYLGLFAIYALARMLVDALKAKAQLPSGASLEDSKKTAGE